MQLILDYDLPYVNFEESVKNFENVFVILKKENKIDRGAQKAADKIKKRFKWTQNNIGKAYKWLEKNSI